MKKLLTITGMFILALGLGACNTMKGAGKDIERGGEKIQGAATNVQQGSSSSGSSTSSGTSNSNDTTNK